MFEGRSTIGDYIMNESLLPPYLYNLNQFAHKSQSDDLKELRRELDATVRVIERLSVVDPDAEELGNLRKMYEKGYTGTGTGTCQCCGRPF